MRIKIDRYKVSKWWSLFLSSVSVFDLKFEGVMDNSALNCLKTNDVNTPKKTKILFHKKPVSGFQKMWNM